MNESMNIATQFDGTFDLTFLDKGETVRSAGIGTNAVIVRTPAREIRLETGDWIIRKIDGELIGRKELP